MNIRDKIHFNVLIVEDNPGDARIIKEMLGDSKMYKYKITVAENLFEAMDFAGKDTNDIILADLNLPDSHGLETFVKIYNQFSEIPVIILSGISDTDLAIKCVSHGAQDYLVKGTFDHNLLERSIRYAIERGRLQAELQRSREHEIKENLELAVIKVERILKGRVK